MIHSRSNDGRVVDSNWHRFREEARRTAFSPEEFGDQERQQYNLDDDDELSAGITGQDNPETYVGTDTRVKDEAGTPDPGVEHDDPIR